MTYHSTSKDLNYFPPLLGNGDLTFAPDCQGVLDYTARDFGKECTYTTFDGAVFRAGEGASPFIRTERRPEFWLLDVFSLIVVGNYWIGHRNFL